MTNASFSCLFEYGQTGRLLCFCSFGEFAYRKWNISKHSLTLNQVLIIVLFFNTYIWVLCIFACIWVHHLCMHAFRGPKLPSGVFYSDSPLYLLGHLGTSTWLSDSWTTTPGNQSFNRNLHVERRDGSLVRKQKNLSLQRDFTQIWQPARLSFKERLELDKDGSMMDKTTPWPV